MSADPQYHPTKMTAVVGTERVATQSQRSVPTQNWRNEAQAALEAAELNLRKNQEKQEQGDDSKINRRNWRRRSNTCVSIDSRLEFR
jgi:hypothetical protein